jgi:hypothetical protein
MYNKLDATWPLRIRFFFRGCSFVTKTLNAEAAGAAAVIITDKDVNEDKSMIDMIEDGTSRKTTIPSLFMVGKHG